MDSAVTNLLQQRTPIILSPTNSCFVTFSLLLAADYAHKMESCLSSLNDALHEVVDNFKKALYFLLVRVCWILSLLKCSIHTHSCTLTRIRRVIA